MKSKQYLIWEMHSIRALCIQKQSGKWMDYFSQTDIVNKPDPKNNNYISLSNPPIFVMYRVTGSIKSQIIFRFLYVLSSLFIFFAMFWWNFILTGHSHLHLNCKYSCKDSMPTFYCTTQETNSSLKRIRNEIKIQSNYVILGTPCFRKFLNHLLITPLWSDSSWNTLD